MPSTVIKSFQYDETGAVLAIEFVSGTRYAYYEVPKAVFEQFGKYREKGVFYNQEIKGKFRFASLLVVRLKACLKIRIYLNPNRNGKTKVTIMAHAP